MRDPAIIVREPDLPRIAAASRALLAELIRPRPSGQWATDHLALMLASRALNADDHGRETGLVIQADGIAGPNSSSSPNSPPKCSTSTGT